MKKQELLKFLREAQKTEESATTIYLKRIETLCARFDVDKELIARIKKDVALLIEKNNKHKKACEDLYAKIEKEKKDDI